MTWRTRIAPDWAAALAPVAPQIDALLATLQAQSAAGQPHLPAEPDILRAFVEPLANVKVLILGQDPYPTVGHAMGLSFSVQRDVRPLPRSLVNIRRELTDDLGIDLPEHGDLSGWARQGVLLLNRCLTVAPGQPGSHRGRGWEAITEHAIGALADRDGPLVAILWGNDARRIVPWLGSAPRIESAHPSPLSAARGFFGSRPFSRANQLLTEVRASPIDWAELG